MENKQTDAPDDAEDGVDRRAQFADALKRARRSPGFKEAVFGACDAARSAAATAILKYSHDAAELQEEWEEEFCIGARHYFRWAIREAASRKFLRTIHKRFPFSECGSEGDVS